MKSVFFVHLYNDYSGSPKVLKDVLLSLDRSKINPFLITSKSEGFLSFWEGRAYKYKYKPSNNKIFMLVFYFFVQWKVFIYLLCSLNKGDMVYINTILPFGASIAAKLRGCDVIYHVHETYIKPKLLMSFLSFFVLSAKEVIFVSRYVSSFYKLALKQKGSILYNSISFNNHNSSCLNFTNRSVCNKVEFKCLMVCSLKKYKGIQEFFNVAHNLENIGRIKFTLQLSAEIEEIIDYFIGIKIPTNVEIHSVNKNLIDIYKSHDLLLNCTNSVECVETFGLTIIEAMNFGLPCIVPKVGGPSEIIEHGITGFCIDSKESYIISEKILELSESNEKYIYLSKNALLRSKDFSYDKFSKQINSILSKY